MQHKQGYIITLLGKKFYKETIFMETKPTSEELEKMLRNTDSVRAFVTTCEACIVEENHIDEITLSDSMMRQ